MSHNIALSIILLQTIELQIVHDPQNILQMQAENN